MKSKELEKERKHLVRTINKLVMKLYEAHLEVSVLNKDIGIYKERLYVLENEMKGRHP